MERLQWKEAAGGTYVAETAAVRLIVYRTATNRYARFCVRVRRPDGTDSLSGSGTRDSVSAAMRAAREVAERLPDFVDWLRTAVMVVDDDDAVRGAVADALRDSGYKVVEASTGEGALRRLERRTPPVVLVSDIDLGPGMSGLELAATVHELWPTIGVLLVSGGAGASAGGDEFLGKPFSTDRFIARVTAIAARTRSTASVSQHLMHGGPADLEEALYVGLGG